MILDAHAVMYSARIVPDIIYHIAVNDTNRGILDATDNAARGIAYGAITGLAWDANDSRADDAVQAAIANSVDVLIKPLTPPEDILP